MNAGQWLWQHIGRVNHIQEIYEIFLRSKYNQEVECINDAKMSLQT